MVHNLIGWAGVVESVLMATASYYTIIKANIICLSYIMLEMTKNESENQQLEIEARYSSDFGHPLITCLTIFSSSSCSVGSTDFWLAAEVTFNCVRVCLKCRET